MRPNLFTVGAVIGWPAGWLLGLFSRLLPRRLPQACDHDKEYMPDCWTRCVAGCGAIIPEDWAQCPRCGSVQP